MVYVSRRRRHLGQISAGPVMVVHRTGSPEMTISSYRFPVYPIIAGALGLVFSDQHLITARRGASLSVNTMMVWMIDCVVVSGVRGRNLGTPVNAAGALLSLGIRVDLTLRATLPLSTFRAASKASALMVKLVSCQENGPWSHIDGSGPDLSALSGVASSTHATNL